MQTQKNRRPSQGQTPVMIMHEFSMSYRDDAHPIISLYGR